MTTNTSPNTSPNTPNTGMTMTTTSTTPKYSSTTPTPKYMIPTNGSGMMTLPNRIMARVGSTPGSLKRATLAEVAAMLSKRNEAMTPRDPTRSARQTVLRFDHESGYLTAQFMGKTGLSSPHLLTRHALNQLCDKTLPGHGRNTLVKLSEIDETSAKLANMVWAKFALQDDRMRRFRTCLTRVSDGRGGKVTVPVIRAVVSELYAKYDHHTFVSDLADTLGDEVRVLDLVITDAQMRLRVSLTGQEIRLNEPVPIANLRNSETGQGSVSVESGSFNLWCTNGCGTFDAEAGRRSRWNHYGNTERIRSGIKGAIEETLVESAGIVDAYQEALDVSIANASVWMEQQMLLHGASQSDVRAAQVSLGHETTTPGGKLASVVDAITHSSQRLLLTDQQELDRMAGLIGGFGLGLARENGGRIPVVIEA